jgi:hypothetical protein
MSTLTLRNTKGSPLTYQEGDENFSNLLVAIGGTNSYPYTVPVPSGTGVPVLTNSPTIDTLKISTELRINNSSNTFYVGFKAGSISANKIWTLPTSDGTANQTLKTDGAGNLSWASSASIGNLNYAQTIGTRTTVLSSATFPFTVVSLNITTTGGPVLVTVYGDAENSTASTWGRLALYRGTTKLGTEIQFEGNGASENSPYSCTVIDTPAVGTHTYSMKVTTLAGGNFNFGELEGPVISAVELRYS